MDDLVPPFDLLQPRRPILGMSAVLLPFDDHGRVDWDGLDALLARTVRAGLAPAVNMDTGYVNLIDHDTQDRVLQATASATTPAGSATASAAVGTAPAGSATAPATASATTGPDQPVSTSVESGGATAAGPPRVDRFVAGAFVADRPGDPFDPDAYRARIEGISHAGGTPVVFPSWGLSALSGPDWVAAHATLAPADGRLIAFELGTQFAPFGRIVDLVTYEALLSVPEVVGAKHSSLDRGAEWDRLRLRDRVRPDFHVFTGNDLALDMVMYGSDYLLGLSAMCPDAFAHRDALWACGDPAFHQINDVLAHLGAFAFRDPVPAYKHDVAQFLALRGWIPHDATHPDAPRRPDSDREVLNAALHRLVGELDRQDEESGQSDEALARPFLESEGSTR